jgi:LPXTG-motif cell wall-anchored protein
MIEHFTNNDEDEKKKETDNTDKTGMIIGIVVGVVIVILLGLGFWLWRRHNNKAALTDSPTSSVLPETQVIAHPNPHPPTEIRDHSDLYVGYNQIHVRPSNNDRTGYEHGWGGHAG